MKILFLCFLMKDKERHQMKKKDIILIAGLLLVAGIGYLYLYLNSNGSGSQVVITQDGKEYGVYRLDMDREIKIESENGYNRIMISHGKVYMEDADCADKYCINQGKISKSKETIICLPHKLSIEIIGTDHESGIDAVVK